jgi:hypothetical protein
MSDYFYSFIKVYRIPFGGETRKFHVTDWKGDLKDFDKWESLFSGCNNVEIIKREIKNGKRPEKRPENKTC